MEGLTNQFWLPLNDLRRQWERFALPGFYGRVVSSFRMSLDDEGEIHIHIKTEARCQSSPDTTKIPWSAIGRADDQRDMRVKEKLEELSPRLYVLCSVAEISGDFRDGFVDKTGFVMAEERRA